MTTLGTVQPSYDNCCYHNLFTYKLTHLWNQLPSFIKRSPNLRDFRRKLETLKASCKCHWEGQKLSYFIDLHLGCIFSVGGLAFIYINLLLILVILYCHALCT